MQYEQSEVEAIVKSMGDQNLMMATDDGPAAIPLTLNHLIRYIHETGACVSRHQNESERSKE